MKINDRMNRSLRDLRISVTDRCNFRCRYCMPEELYGEAYKFLNKNEILSFEEIVRLSRIFVDLGVNKIRLTGGEPLVRSDIQGLVKDLSSIEQKLDLAMTTNGYLLEKYAESLFTAGLKRLSVSLDSLDESTFKEMSGKDFSVEKVLKGIQSAIDSGFTGIKINCVVKKGSNEDSILDLVDYCKSSNLILRFIEFMDVGTLNSWDSKHVYPSKDLIELISKNFAITPIEKNYSGEVADRFEFNDGSGELGFISSVSNPFCSSCTRARISTDGRLVTCLFSEDGVDLKSALRNGKSDDFISNMIVSTWENRNDKYSSDRSSGLNKRSSKIEMFQLGG
ncbi:MAG: GTP 3',8-cyclase MoaA [Chloroflexota bacterium]